MQFIIDLICKLFHKNRHAEVSRNYSNRGKEFFLMCTLCGRHWVERY